MRSTVCVLVVLAFAAVAAATRFTVDDTGEAGDASAGDGFCLTAGGKCTLRAALEEANALAGDDAITLRAGTYTISSTLPTVATVVAVNGADAGSCRQKNTTVTCK